MKIRISGNSLRLRMSQNEVNEFVSYGHVTSACNFPDSVLKYEIRHGDYPDISAAFSQGTVSIYMPSGLVKNWDTDDRVGFDASDANGLFILIEKDFQCLKPRPHEDESDLFPNPYASLDSYD